MSGSREIRRGLGRAGGEAGEVFYSDGDGDDDVLGLEGERLRRIDGHNFVGIRVI